VKIDCTTTIRSNSWTSPKLYRNSSHFATSINISSIHLETADIQIDVVQYKLLIAQEKKHCPDEDLYLYCEGPGQKGTNCHKKQNWRTFKTRSAII